MWTYEQFVAELKSGLNLTIPTIPEKPKSTVKKDKVRYDSSYGCAGLIYSSIGLYGGYGTEPWDKEVALVNAWCTGGISGGSCWDDGKQDNHYSSSGEVESDWTTLDHILEYFCPNITFIRYKRLMSLSKIEEYSRNEYYGNSTNYNLRILLLKDLWQ